MSKLNQYILSNDFDRPTVVIDVDIVEENYSRLKAGLGKAHIHYAVKANPQPEILERLAKLSSRFDAASRGEIELCFAAGAKAEDISFGNTIKKCKDIAWAYEQGIRLYSADSELEIKKIAEHAPGSDVYIRILVQSTEAEWPLSRKFGCSGSYVVPLMDLAKGLGLNPVGLSFHVGSQTRHPHMWYDVLDVVFAAWCHAKDEGHNLTLLNIGGGFPTYYGADITDPEPYCLTIMNAIQERFGDIEYIMAEPGRGMVGNAGMLVSTVLLTSHKTPGDTVRWVYLDVGRFHGLAETENESIKYRFWIPGRELEDTDYCVLAGPTCDSADVMYEKTQVLLPDNLAPGDKFVILNTGAYTTTYSSVAFNGIPPLESVAI
jgi:ornithine decarboxylase